MNNSLAITVDGFSAANYIVSEAQLVFKFYLLYSKGRFKKEEVRGGKGERSE